MAIHVKYYNRGQLVHKVFDQGVPQYWAIEILRQWASSTPGITGLTIAAGRGYKL